MNDQYAGLAGTFIVDPDAGIRVPAEEWDAYQAAKILIKPVTLQNEQTVDIEEQQDASHA